LGERRCSVDALDALAGRALCSSGPEVIAVAFDACADQLTAALAGHWS
jgi:hypothetical protein